MPISSHFSEVWIVDQVKTESINLWPISTMTPPAKSQEAALDHLRTTLKITPKTALTLLKAGYTTRSSIASVSPSQIAAEFGEILKCDKSHVTSYRRAFRRICWVAAQDKPEEHAEECKDWSNKALMARGVWRDDFDEMTGVEIDEMVKKVEGMKKPAKGMTTPAATRKSVKRRSVKRGAIVAAA